MEIVVFAVAVFVGLVFILWRNRRGGSGERSPIPWGRNDRPDRDGDALETARVHVGTAPGPGGSITGIGGLGGGGLGGGGGNP
jgi:hypothetical protein